VEKPETSAAVSVAERRAANQALGERIGVVFGHIHAATAEAARMAAEFDSSEGWGGIGMRNCAHWLSVYCGLNESDARELLRVGHALEELPVIAESFGAGRLSLDKVRSITWVAKPHDEHLWVELAEQASGMQLSRICHTIRDTLLTDDPERARRQRERRGFASWWQDADGMLAIFAKLPPEDGRIVLNAIEAAVRRRPPLAESGAANAAETPSGSEPSDAEVSDNPFRARRADGLVRICEEWLQRAASAHGAAERTIALSRLVVHVDLDTLTGENNEGRCHLENGPALSRAAALRLGCDAEVQAIIEREGKPLGLGRKTRVISARLHRLRQSRDQFCRYPGCPVPAMDTEGHHVEHWTAHGPTDLVNIVSLCKFHHGRHHEGHFKVVATDDGEFRFETPNGASIPPGRVDWDGGDRGSAWLSDFNRTATGAGITPTTSAAGARGEPMDVDHTLTVMSHNAEVAAARRTSNRPDP
jgi:Domain of unknown function (DUF222)